jgi:hypothetical protein
MAGFNVNGLGGTRSSSNIKPIYNYTWEIDSLFEDPQMTSALLAKDATLPTFTISKDTVDGSSLVYKYAGMVTWEDVRITFYDVVLAGDSPGASTGTKASKILKDWRERVWAHTTGLKAPTEYKKDSKIITYTSDWVKSTTWTLRGSWPSIVKEGDLTYTSTDIKVIEVTISYDWAESDAPDSN